MKEPELMTLQDAIKEMNPSDGWRSENYLAIMGNDRTMVTNQGAVLKIDCGILSEKGRITPTAPKVSSFQDYWDKEIKRHKNKYSSSQMNLLFDECKSSFEHGKVQGRLERDLEARPVIEKVGRYMENHTCNDFSMVMDNLKPLNPE